MDMCEAVHLLIMANGWLAHSLQILANLTG